MTDELCFLPATELARRIQTRELSATEVMEAHLARIARFDPVLNAIPTLLPERALAGARAADDALARGDATGPLHGLPIAHKDLLQTKGIRTTYGSPIFRDFVPEVNSLMVERLEAAGAITIGKTNTPEFGAGSQTFNPVFGVTRNPYDLTKTCGGSSGGAAVALAAGMLPIADGTDMGGSLRNPAGFCNIVGFRTAPGRVPAWPAKLGWQGLSVEGPMARTVADVALLLSVMAGPDARAPIAIDEPGSTFAGPLERDLSGVRIAWSPDLGGIPVDQRVLDVLAAQRATFEALGCTVIDAAPDFSGADEAFRAWRAFNFAASHGALLDAHRDAMKETVVWNIEEGLRLPAAELGRAELARTELYQRIRRFMEEYDYIICPVSQVPPFDIEQQYITEINGVAMETYIDWMRSCYYISVTGLPAISMPAGFTPDGLPVGLQIVGRHRAERSVLELAYAFEQATGFWKQHPVLAEQEAG